MAWLGLYEDEDEDEDECHAPLEIYKRASVALLQAFSPLVTT